jgi:ABC-type transport system involved in multi-copper enzyme maturation permease subunit
MKAADLLDRPLRFVRRFFIDPLSVKELSGIARRWQVYVGRCLYIGLIGFIVWIFWNTLTERGGWMSPSAYAELGRNLFMSFFFLQLAVVTLGGITAASDMITREVRGGTLGLLALTPLTPWRIVAGKWKAAMIQTSTVLLCGAPVFAVCVYLGGVGLKELAYSLTLSVVGASLGAAISLCCSALFRASYVATIVTLITLLVYCVVPLLPMFGMRGGGQEEWMTFLAWVHPLYAAVGATVAQFGASPWSQGWYCASPLTMLLVYFLLRCCTARIRTLIRQPGSGLTQEPTAQAVDELGNPRTSFFARMLRGRTGVWQSNAILWKELSTRRVGTGGAARVGVAILAFLMLTTMGSEGWWRVMLLWFSWIILYLVALANGVSLFVTEREERKWDVLLSTPLRARELIWAKLLAGLAGLAPLAILLVVFWGLMTLAYDGSLVSVVMGTLGLILGALLTYMVGAFMSLTASNQRAAFSASFGIMVALLFVVPTVVGMLEGFHVLPRGEDYAEFIIGVTNPGTYLVYLSELLERSYRWDGWSSHMQRKTEKFWSMFVIYAPLYAALIGGLVVWMNQRFDRATGRS